MALSKQEKKEKRLFRVRKKLKGDSERPRLSVFISNQHIYAQLIDDERGLTLGSFTTCKKGGEFSAKSKEAAKYVGKKIAEIAREKQIEKVVFDRGAKKYHGILAELANSAREIGLSF